MRSHGEIEGAAGYGSSDHVCWAYRSPDELARVACEWLADGARLGQRLVYVADRAHDQLLEDLSSLDGRDRLVATGALAVHRVEELYDLSSPIDAPAQLARYAGAVERAVADGFLGIRVVADITTLVADGARRPAHVRWEHHADRWMATHPMAALCAYDEAALGDRAAPIACVHPLRHVTAEVAPFSLWARDDGRIVLDGEADTFSVDALAETLAALAEGEELVVDASTLRFVDGRAAVAVAAAAGRLAALGGSLRLRGAGRGLRSVWRVLELDPAVLAA